MKSIAFTNDGTEIVTGSKDGWIRLWNNAGVLIAELNHQNEVRSGAFSPDGNAAITASDDKTARLWDAATGSPITTLTHHSEVFAVAFTNGNRVVTCNRNGAQIWDLTFQRRLGPPCSTDDDMMCVACSSDGKTAISGDWSGNGMIWVMPQPIVPESGTLKEWVQAEVGMNLDGDGGRHILSGKEWLNSRRRLVSR